MKHFGSHHQVVQENIITSMEHDMTLMVAWLEDTLTPSVALMQLKVMLYDMLIEVELSEAKNGETARSKFTKNRIAEMEQLVEKLNYVANQNNTFQLIVKQANLALSASKNENEKLKKEIEAIKKAWETT